MKKIRLLIAISFILCCLAALGSCKKQDALQKPTGLDVEMTTLTLEWKEVKNAKLYTISIQAEGAEEAKEFIASKNAYTLSQLDEGNYTIKVKANGKEGEFADSPWSEELSFTREHEPGMVFTLIDKNTAYEVTNKGNATGDIVIPATYRNKPVTRIGDKAFFNKSDITSVKIGENVTSIGKFAFANCSYLTSVNLPEKLKELGESAFASCRLLEGKLTVPDGVEMIPPSAFAYCGKLTEIQLGSRLTEIGKNAFTDCSALTSIVIPESVTVIGEYAFADCEKLENVLLGGHVETVGAYAFSAMPALKTITLPNSVRSIGEGAFFNSEALKNVTLGSGVEEISLGAFMNTALWKESAQNEVYVGNWFLGCKDPSATTVTFKNDTVGIASLSLYGNTTLTDLVLPDSVKIIGEAAFALSKINNAVLGYGVEIIGEQAFASCKNLSTVILGSFDYIEGTLGASNLKTIGSYAFQGCAVLEKIEIPDTVETVGSYVFRESGIWNAASGGLVYAGNWLVDHKEEVSGEVTVKDGTVGIANYAFYQCKTVSSIKLPASVKVIGRAAFYECAELTGVELPDSLKEIKDYTFYRCTRLKLSVLPASLKTIGRSAFYKCGSVYTDLDTDTAEDRFSIPDSVETIGDYAFYGCGQGIKGLTGEISEAKGIDELVIGNGVKSIGNNAFYNFVSLKQVIIGNGVETIGEKAFSQCLLLEDVTFGSGLKKIGVKAFYKCGALKAVVLPSGLTEVENYAFYKCDDIQSLELGNSLTAIGEFAFYGCDELAALHLPETLQSIGKQAFRNCKALTSVILPATLTSVDAHAFYGCSSLTVYGEAAGPAEGWHAYWNSSYRPVVWNCALSEEKDYVISFEKKDGSVVNRNASNVIAAPMREGYTFLGWDTSSTATQPAYTADTVTEAPNDKKLFAIWAEN